MRQLQITLLASEETADSTKKEGEEMSDFRGMMKAAGKRWPDTERRIQDVIFGAILGLSLSRFSFFRSTSVLQGICFVAFMFVLMLWEDSVRRRRKAQRERA